MKPKIDLEKAGEAEVCGVLTSGTTHKRFLSSAARRISPRAFQVVLRHLLEMAREAGADEHPIKAGRYSLRLGQKSLSVRF